LLSVRRPVPIGERHPARRFVYELLHQIDNGGCMVWVAEEVPKRPADAFAVPTCREFIAIERHQSRRGRFQFTADLEVLGDQILSGL